MSADWPPLPGAWAGPEPGEAVVVRVRLDAVPPAAEAALAETLAPAERARAARFVRPEDRRRAVVGRGVARLLLARATGVAPGALALAAGPQGKPELAGGPAFNLSHAGGLVLVALAAAGRIGVDVEAAPRAAAAWRSVAPRLHPDEAGLIAEAPDPAAAFLRVWTRKEALAKAVGTGMLADPRGFAASPAVLPPPGGEGADWRILELAPDAGHGGAVALDRPGALRCFGLALPGG